MTKIPTLKTTMMKATTPRDEETIKAPGNPIFALRRSPPNANPSGTPREDAAESIPILTVRKD